MREADLFMLTSRMEGMPITLLEAMATETPVIVSAVGGMPEIVQLAQNGYAIPMDDEALFIEKLAELIQQPNERARFAQQGRQALLDRFTIDRFVEDTVTVYKDVIKNLNG
jgi:glycosyltransferase involved in cell wall biosynthesis